MCAILSVRRDVEGPVPREGVFLVASNHVSYLDILVLASLYPSLFLAKREIASWPVFGWIARGAGTLFIDREQAKDVVRAGTGNVRSAAARAAPDHLPGGTQLAGRTRSFPSSHRCWRRRRGPASRAGPRRSRTRRRAPRFRPRAPICWYDSESLLTHFPRMVGLKAVVARVRFCGRAGALRRSKGARHRAVGTSQRHVHAGAAGVDGSRPTPSRAPRSRRRPSPTGGVLRRSRRARRRNARRSCRRCARALSPRLRQPCATPGGIRTSRD